MKKILLLSFFALIPIPTIYSACSLQDLKTQINQKKSNIFVRAAQSGDYDSVKAMAPLATLETLNIAIGAISFHENSKAIIDFLKSQSQYASNAPKKRFPLIPINQNIVKASESKAKSPEDNKKPNTSCKKPIKQKENRSPAHQAPVQDEVVFHAQNHPEKGDEFKQNLDLYRDGNRSKETLNYLWINKSKLSEEEEKKDIHDILFPVRPGPAMHYAAPAAPILPALGLPEKRAKKNKKNKKKNKKNEEPYLDLKTLPSSSPEKPSEKKMLASFVENVAMLPLLAREPKPLKLLMQTNEEKTKAHKEDPVELRPQDFPSTVPFGDGQITFGLGHFVKKHLQIPEGPDWKKLPPKSAEQDYVVFENRKTGEKHTVDYCPDPKQAQTNLEDKFNGKISSFREQENGRFAMQIGGHRFVIEPGYEDEGIKPHIVTVFGT